MSVPTPALPLCVYVPMKLGKEPQPRLGHGPRSGPSTRAFPQVVKLMGSDLTSFD